VSPNGRFCRFNPNGKFCRATGDVMNWVNTPDLPGSSSEPASMPKPVPIPVRQKLHERASQGESVTSLADEYGLSPRTVRHLLKRGREQGEAGLIPAYHAPRPPDHAHPEAVRQAVLALRCDHPTWGAELIRVMLAEAQPRMIGPSPQAIRRWIRAAELAQAPAGRRAGTASTRAREPHQTWQIDASEHIRLADQTEVCWLRILDEATGAVLRTDVFPPGVLDPGRPASDPDQPETVVPALGAARAAASRQRLALGIAGRPAHRPGLLAGRAGRGGLGQSAALPPGQWGGRTVARSRQAVVRALDLRLECRVATATGCDGSRATRALSRESRAIPPGSLSRAEPFGPVLRPGPGRIDLGPSKGLGSDGHASGGTPGEPAGPVLVVQPPVQRRSRVGRPDGVGGIRSGRRSLDVPGPTRTRDPSPSREGIEPGVGEWDGGHPSTKRSRCGETDRSVTAKDAHPFDQFARRTAKLTVRIKSAKPTVR